VLWDNFRGFCWVLLVIGEWFPRIRSEDSSTFLLGAGRFVAVVDPGDSGGEGPICLRISV